MPGTIHVSVMEFKGLPSTSTPTLLKVSMGKREYQTSDQGDFFFPLTTLRDNLVVTLLDEEGNSIAVTGIQTMTIVEKVSWDEIFPLDGGGHVRLKLEFILNEEERNRIRLKREAALKKKQESIPNISHKDPEIASTIGSSVTSTPQAEQKVSDSQTRTVLRVATIDNVAMLANLLPNIEVFPSNSQANYGREEGSILEQRIPKATYQIKEWASSGPTIHATEVHFPEAHQSAFVEKLETQPSPPDVHVNPVSGKEGSSDFVYSGSDVAEKSSLVPLRLEDDHVDKSEQQGPLEKTPSTVRKLVSAFENSLPKQDVKSALKVPSVRSEPKKVATGGHLNVRDPKDVTEPAEPSSGRNENPFLSVDSKPTLENSPKRGENIGSAKSLIGNISNEATKTFEQSKAAPIRSAEKELSTKEWAESPAQLERTSTTEKATISGRMHTDHSEPKKIGKGGHLNVCDAKDVTTPAEPSSGRNKNPFLVVDLKPTLASSPKRGENIDSAKSSIGNTSNEATKTLEQSKPAPIRSVEKELSTREWSESPAQLERTSTSEKATLSGRMNTNQSERIYSFRLSTEKRNSGGTSYAEERGRMDTTKLDVQVASIEKSKSLEYYEEEHFYSENSGMWIFPNDTKHLCITTAGKKVINLLGNGPTEAKSHQKKKSSSSGYVRKGTDYEMKKDQKASQSPWKPRSESSSDDASGGLVGQAIKIAIIVGFGVLVLFTRQRESRKSKRDTHELFFTTSDYMDELTTTEEQVE